jgi:hypothetical protein
MDCHNNNLVGLEASFSIALSIHELWLMEVPFLPDPFLPPLKTRPVFESKMAEAAVPQRLFRDILDRIGRLRAGPERVGAG